MVKVSSYQGMLRKVVRYFVTKVSCKGTVVTHKDIIIHEGAEVILRLIFGLGKFIFMLSI